MKAKVYFVIPEKEYKEFRRKFSDSIMEWDPLEIDKYATTGVRCWLLKTWMFLKQHKNTPFEPILTTSCPPNEICVLHYDHATPKYGIHRAFCIVAQADRPTPALADLVVVQTAGQENPPHTKYIPMWPLYFLIPRSAERGTEIKTLAYFGLKKYQPDFFYDVSFRSALSDIGITLVCPDSENWHDYSKVDLVIAIRTLTPEVARTKPASKLLNAWRAGVPAIVSNEPAYQEIFQTSFDYLAATTAEEVLESISFLRAHPVLYQQMVSNGYTRFQQFEKDILCQYWISAICAAQKKQKKISFFCAAKRACHYTIRRFGISCWKRVKKWND